MYAVAGTQAQSANQNYIALMRLSDINQGRHGSKARDEDDDDMSDSDDEGAPPQIHTSRVAHYGGVNRLRSMPQQPAVVASWGDTGLVQVCLPHLITLALKLSCPVASSQGHSGRPGCIVYSHCLSLVRITTSLWYQAEHMPMRTFSAVQVSVSLLKELLACCQSLWSALLLLWCCQTCMLPHASVYPVAKASKPCRSSTFAVSWRT